MLLVTPPLDSSGGIGREMQYLLAAWATQADAPAMRVIDSRGRRHAGLSPFYLIVAMGRIVVSIARGQCRLLHINISQRGSSARKLTIVWVARLLRCPVVLHLHGSDYEQFVLGLPSPLRWLVCRSFQSAKRVIVLGEGWGKFVADDLGVRPERIVVMANAVPGGLPRAGPADEELCRLLFLGRLGARKGVPELLEALGKPDLRGLRWTACLAGDGEKREYELRAGELGISDRVAFPGWVDEVAVARLLAASDVLVLPSHAEGLPISVLEAMANGLAIVCTLVGALGETVRDGESALVVPVGDEVALAAALAKVIGDRELRRRLAIGAHTRWAEAFDIQAYAQHMAALYDEVAAI